MQRIGRYEVVSEIGHGGMGCVYEARDPELQRQVAIKLLHAHHASLFRDEARALAALNHSGIVTIHEIGEHEGRPYLVMELLRGQSLRELLQHPQLHPTRDRLVEICANVAVAIAEAHERGVLHRDIKPENVVVLDAGGVKVVDFGIARRLDQPEELRSDDDGPDGSRALRIVSAFARTMPVEITPAKPSTPSTRTTIDSSIDTPSGATVVSLASSTQTVFGTPAYMAPEVLGGEPSTPASDIYSLGVVLYECLAGRRPYEAPDLLGVVTLVLEGNEPQPIAGDRLGSLISRMLAHDPQLRPRASEVVGALAARPIRPRRSKSRRIGKLAALVVFGSLLGVAGWKLVSVRSAQTAQHANGPIAVAPLDVAYQTYGDQPTRIAAVLSTVLATIDGIRVVEPAQLELEEKSTGNREATARRLGARYLLRGKLVEASGEVTGNLELLDLKNGHVEKITAKAVVAQNAALVVELATAAAARVIPGAKLDTAGQIGLARKLYETGLAFLYNQNWGGARPFLEQAVQADPTSSRAWDALASARGWTLAPQPLIEDAIDRALVGATQPRRTILQGAAHYFHHDFDAAIATLEPVASAPGLSKDDGIDVAYYLGEAFWHRGDHTRGAKLLQRVFDERRNFNPAGIHLMQHAIVHRDLARAGVLIGRLGSSRWTYEFAAGHYADVATSGEFPLDLQAQIVLGRTPTPEQEARLGEGFDHAAYDIARALVQDDPAKARARFDLVWKKVDGQPTTDRLVYELSNLIDVVASSGLKDETTTLLAFLRSGTSPRYSSVYRRAASLAAPLLGTPAPGAEAGTMRERRLANAMAAEVAGKRREAAALLNELVADPSDTWDFGERIALVRNLRALGEQAQLAAHCKEIARPPVFRYDFLLARRACQQK